MVGVCNIEGAFRFAAPRFPLGRVFSFLTLLLPRHGGHGASPEKILDVLGIVENGSVPESDKL